MSEQYAGPNEATTQGMWVGSTKRMVVSEPPHAWAERPLKRKGKEIRDPLIRKLWVLFFAAVAGLILLAVFAGMESQEDLQIAAAVGILLLVFVYIPTLLVVRARRRRVREAKLDDLTTESYGAACVLKDVRSKIRRIRIPETYRGMRIIAAEGGFARKSRYETIVLPEGMERLSEGLLMGCRGLTQVQLPQRIEEVPASLLEKCTQLTAIVVPLSVRRVGKRAFAGCKSLRDVYLTAAVKDIAEDAFAGCTDVMFHVQEGSTAERFARDHDFSYTYKYM